MLYVRFPLSRAKAARRGPDHGKTRRFGEATGARRNESVAKPFSP